MIGIPAAKVVGHQQNNRHIVPSFVNFLPRVIKTVCKRPVAAVAGEKIFEGSRYTKPQAISIRYEAAWTNLGQERVATDDDEH